MRKIKKLLKKLAVVVGMVSLPAMALDPVQSSFLYPGYGLYLTNNATVLYGGTNVQFVTGDGFMKFSWSSNTIAPTYIGGTVMNGVNVGWTAVYYTNAITATSTNLVANNAWKDVPIWSNEFADSNQTPLTLYCVGTAGDNGILSSNAVTITVVKMYGTNADTGSAGFNNANTFTTVFYFAGNTNTCGSTNLPTAFQQGATGFRLLKTVTANSTTNIYSRIIDIGICGFKP